MSAAASDFTLDLPVDRLLDLDDAVGRAVESSRAAWSGAQECGDDTAAKAACADHQRFLELKAWLRRGRGQSLVEEAA